MRTKGGQKIRKFVEIIFGSSPTRFRSNQGPPIFGSYKIGSIAEGSSILLETDKATFPFIQPLSAERDNLPTSAAVAAAVESIKGSGLLLEGDVSRARIQPYKCPLIGIFLNLPS